MDRSGSGSPCFHLGRHEPRRSSKCDRERTVDVQNTDRLHFYRERPAQHSQTSPVVRYCEGEAIQVKEERVITDRWRGRVG